MRVRIFLGYLAFDCYRSVLIYCGMAVGTIVWTMDASSAS
jgi:hypothetical protein